ncbi:MAG: serine/threonine protein kinase [Myxococcaceae bacterium]|nr:serine/threonine protein kinase [Myxococcaceae bacterium]
MPCPSDEELARFSEGEASASRWEEHVSKCSSCQALLAELMTDGPAEHPARERPALDERFELLRVIGQGGMGRVYEAVDRVLGRRVALKFVGTAAAATTALREGRALAGISHRNVVQVHDLVTLGAEVFLVRELIDGAPLDRWLQSPRAVGDVIDVFRQTARGLAAAHAAGVVHRDVKPANILVGDDGRACVADFGLADVGGAGGASGGTLAYLAPERLAGAAGDERADQYSLCVAWAEALTGARPTADRPIAWPRRVPPRVRRAVERGLSPRPEARFATMEQLLRALDPQRWRLAAAVTALLGLAVASVGAYRAAVTWRCDRAAARIDTTWSAERRARLEAAFGSIGPIGADAFSRAGSTLERFAAGWRETTRAVCRGSLPVAVEPCLERRLDELAALLELYQTPDRTLILDAPRSTLSLTAPERCARPGHEVVRSGSRPLDELEAQLAALALTGQHARVLELLEQGKTLAAEPGASALRGRFALSTGRALMEQGRFKEADRPLFDAATLGEEAREPDVTADAWLLLSRRARLLGQREDAERWLRLAQATGAQVQETRLAVELASARGSLLAEEGKTAEAVEVQAAAEALAEKLFGRDAPLTLKTRGSHAHALFVAGRYAEAARLDEALLERLESLYGPHHPEVAKLHLNLSGALSMAGRRTEAVEHAHRALEMITAAQGPRSPMLVDVLNNLASLYALDARLTEALAAQQRSLEMARAVLGLEHPKLARLLANLAMMQLRHGDTREALESSTEALALLEKLGRLQHPDAVMTLINRALICWVRAEYGCAADDSARGLAEAEALKHATHQARALGVAAAVALSRGDPRGAQAFVERASAVRGAVSDDEADRHFFTLVQARTALAVEKSARAREQVGAVLTQLSARRPLERELAVQMAAAQAELAGARSVPSR